MKIKRLKLGILILLCTVLLFASATLAKYVVELSIDDSITAERFYFRSNVLVQNSDMSQLTPITVYGKTTTLTLSNGAGALTFSDSDVIWELQYYVDTGDGFIPVLATPEQHTLARGLTMSVETLTVGPVIYDGDEYRDVIVEAKSVSPYQKTMRTRLQFDYQEYDIAYSYLSSMGVLTATVTTNADAGNYTFRWLYPLVPDNADPNGILTDAAAPAEDNAEGNSLVASLDSYTTYKLHFFISPEMLAAVNEAVDDATAEELELLISQYLIISYQ